tara:strand:+ start:6616 stop:7170 length:555 start_codon:yes stop_codon:yes gene_type:complete
MPQESIKENILEKTPKNIFLIGMMGSWKSSVGRLLAIELEMELIDTDDAIEEMTEMKISEIFSELWEAKFRDMESAFFIEKSIQTGYVFSTGGGIVLSKENRNALQNNGTSILLKANPKILANRLKNTQKRPLLSNSKELETRLTLIWNERQTLYESSAHVTVDTDDLESVDVVQKILEQRDRF